jgi:uncharacterized membrane protein YphA (DoxX/SURF4 family)
MSTMETTRGRFAARDAVAGLLAATSVVISGLAAGLGFLIGVEARPGRLAPVAIAMAITAARMSSRFQRLALKATITASVAFVVGMTIAVITESPII